jgi:hypothetical protein
MAHRAKYIQQSLCKNMLKYFDAYLRNNAVIFEKTALSPNRPVFDLNWQFAARSGYWRRLQANRAPRQQQMAGIE